MTCTRTGERHDSRALAAAGDCKFCKHPKSNLCVAVRKFTGNGIMKADEGTRITCRCRLQPPAPGQSACACSTPTQHKVMSHAGASTAGAPTVVQGLHYLRSQLSV